MKTSKNRGAGRAAGKIFWGLFFVVSALALIGSAAGLLDFGMNVWIVILGVLSGAVALWSLFHLEWFGVFFPVALIVTVFYEQVCTLLNVESLNLGSVWGAAALLVVGFSILFHKKGHHHGRRCGQGRDDEDMSCAERNDESNPVISTRFGSVIKYLQNKDLKKVIVDCNFGAAKIYFSDAELAKDGAVVDINVSFGGVELFVPRNWRVVDDLSRSFGGVEEKGVMRDTDETKTITLVGKLNFAGVEITYV